MRSILHSGSEDHSQAPWRVVTTWHPHSDSARMVGPSQALRGSLLVILLRLTTRWSRPGQQGVAFSAILALAGRAAHLEAVRQPSAPNARTRLSVADEHKGPI